MRTVLDDDVRFIPARRSANVRTGDLPPLLVVVPPAARIRAVVEDRADGAVLPSASTVVRVDPRRRYAVVVEALRNPRERVPVEVASEDQDDDLPLLGVDLNLRTDRFPAWSELLPQSIAVRNAAGCVARER